MRNSSSGFDRLSISDTNDDVINISDGIGNGPLDEPVRETIMRDLRRIGYRIKHVLIPKGINDDNRNNIELRNWDLWGPLLLCLLLACSMSFGSSDDDSSLVFTAVFMIVWCGAIVVTLNAALLGGKMLSFKINNIIYPYILIIYYNIISTDHSFKVYHY